MGPEDEQVDAGAEAPEASPDDVPPDEAQASENARGEPAPPWEALLDTYPLREPSEDPAWARRIVYVWVGFAVASILFITALLILGVIYD